MHTGVFVSHQPCTHYGTQIPAAHKVGFRLDAGALTASDMEALFKPVPFGEERISIFTQAMDPDVLPVWNLFRNVDEDKQNQTLQVHFCLLASLLVVGRYRMRVKLYLIS